MKPLVVSVVLLVLLLLVVLLLVVLVEVPDVFAAVDCAWASPRWTAIPPTTRVEAASRLADQTLARFRGRGVGLMGVSFGGFTPPSRAPLCACCGRAVHAA
ncbi:hypothetical protein GCM10027053_10580 [Intrasporangium mesophilum]